MKSSTFLCGVVVGVAASMYMRKKRTSMMSSSGQSKGSMGGAAEKAKDKIMEMAMTGFGSTSASDTAGNTSINTSSNSQGIASQTTGSTEQYSPIKSKEANLDMLKDFIRSNPDVKHEVEKILKETHTTISGL
ncbi:hypothetical protein [Paenibacillus wynnii]|uniref:hypothetical protein n=1 Tax=Paenibacillus wynnii TaxID=268407 RepID=UPI002793E8CE|nr:hypothetical protein [Paenibacillus wynnii]MDQ0193017.1 hypothetical protein [Paenibacillus wynnii]